MEGKINFGFMTGKSLAGKTELCKIMGSKLGFTVIDMKVIEGKLREEMGGEDGPFEGKVPMAKIEGDIVKMIRANRKTGKFVFDDYMHETEDEFLKFIEQFGQPDFALFITADESKIKERWMKKNE